MVDPKELDDHPSNWREHPSTQHAALREVLLQKERIGMVDVFLSCQSPSTGLRQIIVIFALIPPRQHPIMISGGSAEGLLRWPRGRYLLFLCAHRVS